MQDPLWLVHPDQHDLVRTVAEELCFVIGVEPPRIEAKSRVPRGQIIVVDAAIIDHLPVIEYEDTFLRDMVALRRPNKITSPVS